MNLAEIWTVAGAIILSLGGGGLLVLGLSNWLGKVWAGRLMAAEAAKYGRELELLRAGVGRSVRVHAAQFEVEFSAYRDIWAKLVEVRRAVLSLRPVLDYVDPNEDEEERKRNRLTRFGGVFQEFLDSVDKNRPFYSPGVWVELQVLIDFVHGESVDYQHREGRMTSDYYREAMENAKKISVQIDVLCAAIRTRIGDLAVVE